MHPPHIHVTCPPLGGALQRCRSTGTGRFGIGDGASGRLTTPAMVEHGAPGRC